jgi:hypothetical protein
VRCTERAREFAQTGHTQPGEFPPPTQAVRKLENCLKTAHQEQIFALRRDCNGRKRPKTD